MFWNEMRMNAQFQNNFKARRSRQFQHSGYQNYQTVGEQNKQTFAPTQSV